MPKRKSKPPKSRKKKSARKARKPRSFWATLALWPAMLVHSTTDGLRPLLKWPLRMLGIPLALWIYFMIPVALFYHARSRAYDIAKVEEMPERSVVYDRRGEELGRLHGEKRDIIRMDQISNWFILAILAREDERFFKHGGVDWIGFARATLRNVKDRSMTQGASTLTMQLARNSYNLNAGWLSFSGTLQDLDRKFLEIAVTYRIESNYEKEEILEHYVNRIFWGHTIMGIEEAAQTYFEKSAKDLNLSESALLAGIVRGPNAFSPFKSIEDAESERDATLDRMVTAELISQEEADAAKAEEIKVRPKLRRSFHDSWPMNAVRRELERILEEENIEYGGLQITTTIDSLIQQKAEAALDAHLKTFEKRSGYKHQTRAEWQALPEPRPEPQYLQGSVVVIENLTGAVVATVGGRNADESKFDRATQSTLTVGSIFKPFVYLTAFERGLRPNSMISDNQLIDYEVKGAGRWKPQNSDRKFNGMQPASYGLIRSRNTMSVRVGGIAGLENVAQTAHAVGFTNAKVDNVQAYLGNIAATPEEVASAYTVFPNGGKRYPPRIIAEIRDRNGNVLYSNPMISYQAVGQGAAWTTSKILHDVVERGTGYSVKRLGFNKPCGGKTGTTNDYKDGWYAGYTSSLTCAVWVGLDTPKTVIDRGYGSVLALPVWTEVMKTADRLGYKSEGLTSKLSFTDVRICRDSGKRATDGCEEAGAAYTDSVAVDIVPNLTEFCTEHTGDPSVGGGKPPKANPVDSSSAPKAVPVEENSPPKAIPVE